LIARPLVVNHQQPRRGTTEHTEHTEGRPGRTCFLFPCVPRIPWFESPRAASKFCYLPKLTVYATVPIRRCWLARRIHGGV
jgi:hypothetical protein